jgi:hypothetical protein
MAMAFVVRNAGVATVAVSVLGQLERAVSRRPFSESDFLLLAAGMGFRVLAGRENPRMQGTDHP